MIFHTAPVTPGYKYGQPVIIMDNNEIQSSKGRGTPAVVIGLDNTNFYGAYVYRCVTYDGNPGRTLIEYICSYSTWRSPLAHKRALVKKTS